MKIAIVCDWLVTYAGAERVLAEMIQCFPEADLFSVIDFLSPENRHSLNGKKANTTFIQQLPWAKKHYRLYLPLMPYAIEQCDVSSYDLVISNSHAVAKGVITHANQIHLSYVHTPIRYAWDLHHQYLHKAGLKGFFAKIILHKMRLWDCRTAFNVDHFVANSKFIAKRIQKTYRRSAEVIYPPVDVHQFQPVSKKDTYYLAVSRLVPYKKMDLIVETFANLPDKKLIVIGEGPDLKKIKKLATKNIELLGFQSNEKVVEMMQNAKALIFAAEEDFGIVPVEAQACGTPVIAFGKGGAIETVRGLSESDPTGVFFQEQTVRSLKDAINKFESVSISAENCRKNALRFSPDIFREHFKTIVKSL